MKQPRVITPIFTAHISTQNRPQLKLSFSPFASDPAFRGVSTQPRSIGAGQLVRDSAVGNGPRPQFDLNPQQVTAFAPIARQFPDRSTRCTQPCRSRKVDQPIDLPVRAASRSCKIGIRGRSSPAPDPRWRRLPAISDCAACAGSIRQRALTLIVIR